MAEPVTLATFPDGERIRLVGADGLKIADLTGPIHADALRRVRSLLGDRERLLVLGCGDGFTSHYLAHMCAEVKAMDWREDWVRYAARRYRCENLKYATIPLTTDAAESVPFCSGAIDKLVLFDALARGLAVEQLLGWLRTVACQLGDLPLFWSETLPADEADGQRISASMSDCLQNLQQQGFQLIRQGAELCAWPQAWPVRYDIDNGDFKVHSDLLTRLLARSDRPLVFGPGLPQSWPYDFFLIDNQRQYGRWFDKERKVRPLFCGLDVKGLALSHCEFLRGLDDSAGTDDDFEEGKKPAAVWRYVQNEEYRSILRQLIRFDLKKGYCIEGYDPLDGRAMLIRTDLQDRLPLYPLFDTLPDKPDWSELTNFLEWTKKKALLTVTPRFWREWAERLNSQPHRGLLILVDFSEADLDEILAMARQGWRIGLGACRPIDQVPLQSFEKFRLLLEHSGIVMEALWMGQRPPDPAYINNIYSRFGRLLLSTRGLIKSWDSKKVRFCLTLKAGQDSQTLLQQAYCQMAGLDELQDYLMLYRWASALENAGQIQAAKSLFGTLERARVPQELEPERRKAGVLYHLGRIAEAESDIPLAMRYYSRCLDLDSEFKEAGLRLDYVSRASGIQAGTAD